MTLNRDPVTLTLIRMCLSYLLLPTHKVCLRSNNYERIYRYFKFSPLPPLSLPPSPLSPSFLSLEQQEHRINLRVYTFRTVVGVQKHIQKTYNLSPLLTPHLSPFPPLSPLSPLVYTNNLFESNGDRVGNIICKFCDDT